MNNSIKSSHIGGGGQLLVESRSSKVATNAGNRSDYYIATNSCEVVSDKKQETREWKNIKHQPTCHMSLVSNYSLNAGRSMVEMLGVLAVIGVLSIGGLAGYSKAMTYHRANTILSDAQLAYAWMTGIEEIEEGEHKPSFISQSGKEIYAFRSASGDDFVKIVGIEENTCERLLNMQGDKLHIYEGNSKMTVCSETNTMTFGFSQYAPDASVVGGTGTGGDNTGDDEKDDSNTQQPETAGCEKYGCSDGVCRNNGECCDNWEWSYEEHEECCHEDMIYLDGVFADGFACCPFGSTGYGYDPATHEDRCCRADEIQTDDYRCFCCPKGSSAFDEDKNCCIDSSGNCVS